MGMGHHDEVKKDENTAIANAMGHRAHQQRKHTSLVAFIK